MDAGIKKIIELIKRTGDRFVVLDTASQEPFVVMPFDEYEDLMGGGECLCESCRETEEDGEIESGEGEENDEENWGVPETEGDLIEKINRDIAEWRERQQSTVTENLPTVEPLEAEEGLEVVVESPKTTPATPAETVQPVPEKKTEEAVDEKYYFEPVVG